jgi:hypothetical protein
MIDQHGSEVLVLTCGHLFREMTANSRLTVDVSINQRVETFAATVIDYQCQEADIGLVSFHTSQPVTIARLLPAGQALQVHETVSSFGCDHGANPSRRDSHITKLNRFLGPSNVEVARAPVQGRSGGGLFNAKNELIGVCYAADQSLDEGLYSGPDVVYAQLNRLGLGRLYASPTASSLVPFQQTPKLTSRQPRSVDFPDRSLGDEWKQAMHQAASQTLNNLDELRGKSIPSGSLTATFRDVQGIERAVTIPNPSVGLIDSLVRESHSNSEIARR